MAVSHIDTRHMEENSSVKSYLNQSDSDEDENSFKPPALSDYALALLQKEKEDKENLNPSPHPRNNPVPKRVNFRNSPDHYQQSTNKLHHSESHNNGYNNTVHTSQSEYETIFTKTVVDKDFDTYGYTAASSNSAFAAHDRSEKTPMKKSAGSGSGSGSFNSSHGSLSRLRSSSRRTRGFSGLGPPKRASLNIDEPLLSNPQLGQQENDISMNDASNSPVSKQQSVSNEEFRNSQSTPQKSSVEESSVRSTRAEIHFEGLNPYQYSRKYNLPSSELPKLVKIYFEQQKNAAKDSLNLNSPMRLKEVIHHKIEEELAQEARFSPNPQRKLFKNQNEPSYTPVENPQAQPSLPSIDIYSDKENHEPLQNYKSHINSIERPSRSQRQPLAQLNESRQQQLRNKLKPLSYKQPNDENYQEHYYKQSEPLKEPDNSHSRTSRLLTINGKQYEKLELLGKGGSSKVFKVKSLNNKVYAIKKISFDEFDESSINGFKGEIDLLSKLRDQERVVRLIDHSLGQGSLLLVMECGDIDLSHVLAKRLELPLDVEFVRFHANEVLKCVKAVHDAGIVHSDLKPANFLFVKGILKIIDFGIANAVPEHTVNIYRESQIGTPNYMAPEALIDNNQHLADTTDHHKSQWKVGKPSDIWSCGCIIYQMIYGRPPYGGYQGSQRLLAIMNPDVKVVYPDKGLGGTKVPGTALETIQACLKRDPGKRWTAQDLLEGPFLKPRVVSEQFVNDLVKNAITYGVGKANIDDDELKTLADDVWKRVSQLTL